MHTSSVWGLQLLYIPTNIWYCQAFFLIIKLNVFVKWYLVMVLIFILRRDDLKLTSEG